MPVAAPIVAYFALTGVAAFIATTVIYAVETLALNAVLRALSPRAPKPVALPRTQSISDTLATGKLLYGMVCTGGAQIIPPIATTGTDPLNGQTYAGNWTHRALVLAQHEVDSYGPVRFEQAYIDQSQLAPINNSLDSGLVLASGNVWDNVLHQTRYAMVRCYRGTSVDTADYILMQADPAAFTSSFRTRGVAVIMATFAFGDWFQGGVPPISVCVNGMKVYDPRKDSTNGGVGSHRYATPSTWEWSNNPVLCAASLIMFDRELGGGGYDPAVDIDWALAAAAANICDASVDTAPTIANLLSQGVTTITITGNTLTKSGGVSAWDSSVRSTSGFKAGRIGFRAGVSSMVMGGLSAVPATSASFTDIDYAWYANVGAGWQIRELGTQIVSALIPAGAVQATDIAEIMYDGTNVIYLMNGKIIRQNKVPTVGMTLYFDSSFFLANSFMVINQQRRYSCNLELDGAALFEDNLGYLIDAAFGRVIERDGKWRLYAGAWDTPSFTIEQADWLGQMQIQAVTPRREGRWNGVRGFYYDPLRNWQRVECQPRTNAAYKTADGGERIWQELDRPAINDESTAQRMAEFTLRQSRNGIKVSGTLPPRFQYLALWETGLINFLDLGWANKVFRLMSYTLNPDGSVGVGFTEEQQSDWTDMASAEFNQPDQHLIPYTATQGPKPPTSLAAAAYSETISFTVGLPVRLLPGDLVEIWESAAQGTVFSGYSLAASAKSSLVNLRKADGQTRYYRAVIKNVNNVRSTPYPPEGSNAVASQAGTHGLIGRGVHLNGNSAYKVDNGLNIDNAWDSDLYSILGYKTCHLQFKGGVNAGGNVMLGLAISPGASASYTNIDFAWYDNITDWRIYEAGTLIQTIAGAVLGSDVAWITYDGTYVRYYLNGIGIRTVSAPGLTLFLDSSFFGFNDSMVNSIDFGPGIAFSQTDTAQIVAGAATEIFVVTLASKDTLTNDEILLAINIPARQTNHKVILTVVADVWHQFLGPTATVYLAHLSSLGVPSVTTGYAVTLGTDAADITSPGRHYATHFQFDASAGVNYDYGLWYHSTNGTDVGHAINISLQAEVIKR